MPDRTIQTGLGNVPIKTPKVRDRSDQGVKFNGKLVPPYLKRTKSIEDFIPRLYLKGISTGDMQATLESLLGEGGRYGQPSQAELGSGLRSLARARPESASLRVCLGRWRVQQRTHG